jgi:hypothetical protein
LVELSEHFKCLLRSHHLVTGCLKLLH